MPVTEVHLLMFFLSGGALVSVGSSDTTNFTNLTFMLIISYGEHGFNSSGALPAIEMALEDINDNSSVLPGYKLDYDRIRNSQVIKSPCIQNSQ